MSINRPLRIGLIGAGTIAFSAHLPAIRRLRDEYQLVSIADIRVENAARAADEFGAETHYADYREMLDREELDVVDICTPEFLHPEQTEAAAAAGVHILCEKPMSASIAGAPFAIDLAYWHGFTLELGLTALAVVAGLGLWFYQLGLAR
ncbi:MAG: Gfo/Idh/MocA family oxidoreductase, partial [Chloroflexota bacterium]